MIITVPDSLLIETISVDQLPTDWFSFLNYPVCQQIGDAWFQNGQSAVLKVPSAIVPNEWNFLLNPAHPDFSQIQLLQTEPFIFDSRIKE